MKMMPSEFPHRISSPVKFPPLSAVGHEAQLLPPRKSTPFESPSRPSQTPVVCPRSPPRKPTAYAGVEGVEAQCHDGLHSPYGRTEPTRCLTFDPKSHLPSPIQEPVLSAVVGREVQLVNLERSSRRKINTAASLKEHIMQDMSRRSERFKVINLQSPVQDEGVMTSTAGNYNEVLRFLPSSPWVLHFGRDVVKGSAFDEQVRSQLRSTGESYKLGRQLDLVDVGTYAKLCNASVHDLIKLIHHKLQNVKVHKRTCEDLVNYLRGIDELLLSLFKSLDMANLSHGLHRLLGVLKESLADAYVLFKRCETRSPIHVNVLSNIPAKLIAIEEEIQRIIPVLRLAFAHHQDILSSQANMESIAVGSSSEDSLNVATTPHSEASSQKLTDVKYNRSETSGTDDCNIFIQNTGMDHQSLPRSKIAAPWHVAVHPLKMHRWGTRSYLCRACHQIGNGCVFSCDKCNYYVHPSCVELNEAIQQLEEIRIHKLSMCDDSVKFDRDLCGLVR